jgi:hypothetical protein
MKKILMLAVALMLALSLAACGGNSDTPTTSSGGNGGNSTNPPASQGGNDNTPAFTEGEWPDNDWTAQLPKPAAGTIGKVSSVGSENQTLSIQMTWTREEASAYCDEARSGGFNVNAIAYYEDTPSLSTLLEAENSAGYELSVTETEIRIVKP